MRGWTNSCRTRRRWRGICGSGWGNSSSWSTTCLLYDLTSSYFEGQAKGNPMAKRGYSRDSRPDCLQVVIALIVTREGYPLGYEVFDGNTADVTTVQGIITQGGGAAWQSAADLGDGPRQHQRGQPGVYPGAESHYIVGTPKAQMGQFAGEITGRMAGRCGGDRGEAGGKSCGRLVGELLLCRSRERAAKEQSMAKRFEERMEAGLGEACRCRRQRSSAGCGYGESAAGGKPGETLASSGTF